MSKLNELLYYLLYWRLMTMQSYSLVWRNRIIEDQETPGLRYALRLPSGSPCPFCGSVDLVSADHPAIPIFGLIRCNCCAHIHLVDNGLMLVEAQVKTK